MGAVFKRELRAFFLTPIGYVFMGMFLLLSGLFFTALIYNPVGIVDYSNTLGVMAFILIFVIPILTMKLFSDERKSGTDQLLMTSPVSVTGIILGKYFAAVLFFACSMTVTMIYPLILSRFTIVDANVVLSGYLGYFLMGASFISIGLFISSITENQVVAAITSFGAFIFLFSMDLVKQLLNLSEKGQKVFDWFLILNRYWDFNSGIINFGSIIFFVSLAAIFLFFTLRVIEKRRWSKG